MARIHSILTILFMCLVHPVFGQSDLQVGQWKAHLPFRKSFHVSQSEQSIFYATEWGLLGIDKSDRSPTFLTKVEGLSDVGLSQVKFNATVNGLLIAYRNSNLDLVFEDDIINFNEILRNEKILGDKQIFHIQMIGPKAYLSAAFGLVELDLENLEFGFTTFIPFPVYASALYEGQLYVATEMGIYRIGYESNLNLADFGLWEKVDVALGLPENYQSTELIVYNDLLYGVVDNRLLKFQDGSFTTLWDDGLYRIAYLSAEGDQLIAGLRCITNCPNRVIFYNEQDQRTESPVDCHFRTTHAIQNGTEVWYADEGAEFRRADNPEAPCEKFEYNSPFSQNVSEIEIYDGKVYVASGGVDNTFSYRFRTDGLFVYENLQWSFINTINNEFFRNNQIWDVFTIEQDPNSKNLMVGSYLEGLVELDGEEVVNYFDQSNSSIGGTVGDENRERISGMIYDDRGNLWISNYLAARPISVRTPDGEWQSFNFPITTLTQSAIDQNGFIWFVVKGNSAGLLVLDPGQDVLSAQDDRSIYFNSNNSTLPNNSVNCVKADLDGVIWVGTTEGPVIFNCGPEDFFTGACPGIQETVIQDFNVALLLGKENIETIEIDGANRKWFGTRNGIFVQSADAEELVMAFNESNSPLLDNQIIDIAIDRDDGRVFIGTNKGVIEYKGTATEGGVLNSNKVVAYPNPVRPDYRGPIAIRGLARDADVIVTDVSGKLVYKTQAFGGQAIWDGNDLNGVRAASGVYLIYATSTQILDNPDAIVAKIVFMN